VRGSKPRVWMTGQAQGLHAPPAIAGWQVRATSTQPGFRIPTTDARWQGKEYADLCVMPMQ